MPSSTLFTIPYLLISICLLSVANTTHAVNTDSLNTDKLESDNQKLAICLNNLVQTAPFSSVKETFIQYRPFLVDPSVLESLNYQPEFAKEPWDYLASLVDEERVIDGIAASEDYADVLAKIETHYGVNRYDVLGVWGVESDFGTKLGKKDVVNSLATLSCFGRRQSYFRTEYVSALKILKQGDIVKSDFKGSWAGAFGQTQFMPSTFLQLAQDFDGDNRKDLVNSQADALASTANFLKNSGYQSDKPWGYEVRLPSGTNFSNNRKNKKSISYWQSLGITLPDNKPLPNTLSSVGLFLPSGRQGPAFLVGRNFDAFYAYNASENYALAIAHLSQRIKQQDTNVNFATPWPTDDPGLNRKESREVQESLNFLDYSMDEVDGIIGDRTRKAIQKYQADIGIEIDGKAGQKIHRRLMASSAELREVYKVETKIDNNIESMNNNSLKSENKEVSKTKFTHTLYDLIRDKTLLSIIIALFILFSVAVVILIKRK
ncbi:lytic murein transglycosylase [Psychrobacter sp. DAB_AL62B]|uniref:lytic murein transglycosylase n=1 Tax=Psychrobacter sp. DAB_AL62B TaxID=1028420 RepID=UPI00238188E3|nr:lytic murein transglycosylase [Psychrobacter sp. DAB_AL62B]MDE4456169.1 lytic murein transglycosylase [Psychrobacter sp. DAB_AL62B]